MMLRSWMALAVGLASIGCSAGPGDDALHGAGTPGAASSGSSSDPLGAVGLELTLPAARSIDAFSWSITGPAGASTVVQRGTLSSKGSGVRFITDDLPAAAGYRLALTGTAADGSITCAGSAPFDVAAGATAQVTLPLGCTVAAAAHVTLADGTSFDCAAWTSVTGNPLRAPVGVPVSLAATATAPSAARLTYAWNAPSGTFDTPSMANTHFTCTTPGPVDVTFSVADGPVPSGYACSAALGTKTIPVTCDPEGTPPPPPAPAPALPPWGAVVLALGLGAVALRRLEAEASRSSK